MRCFISIDVEDTTTRENLMTFIDKVSEVNGVRPVNLQNLRITLLFLGNIDEADIDELQKRFVSITDNVNVSPFTCTISGIGTFPHLNYIEVVWAGAKPASKLNELHVNYTEGMNFKNEDSELDFVPHVTLGRANKLNSRGKREVQQIIEGYDQEFGSFDATNVRLKASKVQSGGPIYRDLEVCEL